MKKNNRYAKQEEERRHPDCPDELVYLAANNKPFAERFVGVFRLAKAGVKKDGQR